MNDAMNRFLTQLTNDAKLRDDVIGAPIDAVAETARGLGYDVSAQDLGALVARSQELSDDQLDQVSGGVTTTFQITLSPEDILAAQTESSTSSGTAASSFCLAGDVGVDGSWNCVDEEVEVSDSGTIRGRQSRSG